MRPLSVCVLLLVGAGPAAALACELACSTPSGHGHHDAAPHHHAPAADDRAAGTGDVPLLDTRDPNCEHDVVGSSPAVTSSAMKVFAPIALDVLETAVSDVRSTDISPAASSTASPPGVRSGPLPLRV